MPGKARATRRQHLPASGVAVAAVAITSIVATTALPATAAPGTENPTAGAPTAGASSAASADSTITLITGDVIHVTENADGTSSVDVGEKLGTEGVQTYEIGDDLYVYPTAALPFVASGVVDSALFNVTQLIADGYDDASTDQLPVIVEYADGGVSGVTGADAIVPGVSSTLALPSIDGAALGIDKADAAHAWSALTASSATDSAGIEKIWLDGKVQAALDVSVPLVGAPEVWDLGYDGEGTDIAVLDSGIDATHADLADHIDVVESFVPDQVGNVDPYGHGTHVASIATGTGAASDGAYTGVAPGADLMIGKVLDDNGQGLESWVIAGMEWAVDNGADVVNMSLGSYEPSDGTDPMSQAVNTLSADSDALFVIASGNMGSPFAIGSPGAADAALTVGGTDKSDVLGWFPSQGPRSGDHAVKPDLVAPGDTITAARSAQSWGEGPYTAMTGTSMSTPHVAGAAALLKQAHPEWTGEQLKDALVSHTKTLDAYTNFQVGSGRLDIPAALDTVFATANAWSGWYDWPHEGDTPVDKTITYTNAGDEDVTLTLALDVDAPAGTFALSADEIVVPAGDTTDVVITADPNAITSGTDIAGTVVATDTEGVERTKTLIGIAKERELYDITITGIDRAGQPDEDGIAVVVNLDTGYAEQVALDPTTGQTTIRREPGNYAVMMTMTVEGERGEASQGIALLGDPEVVLDHDQEVVMDAREANLVSVATWKGSNVDERVRRMDWYRAIGDVSIIGGALIPVTVDSLYAAPTEAVSTGEFEFLTRWRVTKPLISIRHEGVLLDEHVQYGTVLLDGKQKLDVVDVGTGTPAEWAAAGDVAGKAVTVTRSDAVSTQSLGQQASDAGVTLLIGINDRPGLWRDVFTKEDWTTSSAMAVSLRQEEGEAFRADVLGGGVTIKVKAETNSPYVLDLLGIHPDAIPSDLAYTPARSELARVKSRYQGSQQSIAGEFRWDLRPYADHGVGFSQQMEVPIIRKEFVTAGDTRYHKSVMQYADDLSAMLYESRDDLETYDVGERTRVSWFGPVSHPRLSGNFWRPWRQADQMQINMPYLSDSDVTHGGTADWGHDDVTSSIYQGDTLIRQNIGQALYLSGLSTDRLQYRYVLDALRDADRWRTSPETHTEWMFWSEGTADQTALALIQLDYDVRTNLAGDLRRSATTIGVRASHMAELVGAPEITSVVLELSTDDGATWTTAELTEGEDGWLIADLPELGSNEFVSVRMSAADADGNSVKQEVIRAVGTRA